MNLIKINKFKKLGKIIGFMLMYVLFTTILFFILKFSKKLPLNWSYFHVCNITIFITLIGSLLKLSLK